MALPDVFKNVCEKNGWVTSDLKVEIPLEGGRKQLIVVDLFSDEDEKMARIYSEVGEASALSETRLRAALGINFQLPHGALAIRGDQLVMCDTFILREADSAEVENSMKHLAMTADKYERLIYGTDEH